MRSVAFHTLGCKVNIYETQAMQQLMESAGYRVVDFEDRADVYIINTCSVTNIADKKSRQMLHRAKKENPHAVVVAAGCYVQASADKLKEDAGVDIIIGNDLKTKVADIVDEYFRQSDVLVMDSHVLDISKSGEYESLSVSSISGHTRAFIKVQDGCNMFCTYCIIPYTRGRIRSRHIDDIREEISQLASKGYKEFVLTGIHLSSYGIDMSKDFRLIDLIEEIAKIEGVHRIRIGSLEPRIITEGFLDRLRNVEAFCPHFHLSLQSGSDKTLRRMNRHYSATEYKNGVHLIRTYFENPALTTDIIVGFPGEDALEFEESMKFVRDVNFFETHIFPYSIREGTQAATMPAQVDKKTKSERLGLLNKLHQVNARAFRESHLGQIKEVLLEEKMEIAGVNYFVGHTKEYVKVAIRTDEDLKNMLIQTSIEGMLTDDTMLASLLS